MTSQTKVKPNDPCPCGSGKKYKKCCKGKVDWTHIFRSGSDFRKHLSIRGRNNYFVNRIAEILGFENLTDDHGLKDYKAAFTSRAVREIHEAVMEAWPRDMDIYATLERAASEVSGLYIGDYGPDYILRGIIRHSIYANKILVVDPFLYPSSVRDQYNPILEPDQYRSQTLKNVNFWLCLLPWIKAGIVEIIRTPADFNSMLKWESMQNQQRKFKENPELKRAVDDSFLEWQKRHGEKQRRELLLLSAPDSYLRDTFDRLELAREGCTVEEFIRHIQKQRDQAPDFLEPMGSDETSTQMHMWTTGSSYDIARLTAGITRSYLVTDLHVRWREIELDRESHSVENKVWAPFAKAIQEAPLKYLNAVRLEDALTLRQEQRLESLRGFLQRVWKEASTGDAFDEVNSLRLAEELQEQIRLTEVEWNQIGIDLMKRIGEGLTAGLLAAGPLIAAGHGMFLAAAAGAASAFTLSTHQVQRSKFPDKFPAAFFMKLQD